MRPLQLTDFPRLPYKVHKIDFSKNTQKEPWFLAINPNGRIPALTDSFPDGQTISLFESGSIMQYLVERYDRDFKLSYPPGTREHYEMNSWLFFQNAGVGPMQGQASMFTFCRKISATDYGRTISGATRPLRSSTASRATRTKRVVCTRSWKRSCRGRATHI